MKIPVHSTLARRERQIMEILYRKGTATAAEVMRELPGNPSDSTVRTHLRILEEKGHVRHQEAGLRYVYSPTAPRSAVRQSALRHLIDTFFDGSIEKVVAALIGSDGTRRVKPDELRRIADLIARATRDEESRR
jgi:predicted transcriptional regulator